MNIEVGPWSRLGGLPNFHYSNIPAGAFLIVHPIGPNSTIYVYVNAARGFVVIKHPFLPMPFASGVYGFFIVAPGSYVECGQYTVQI